MIGYLKNYEYVLDFDYVIDSINLDKNGIKQSKALSRQHNSSDNSKLNCALSYTTQSEYLDAIFRGHTHRFNGFRGGIVFHTNSTFSISPYKTKWNLMTLFSLSWPRIFTLCSMFTPTYLTLRVDPDAYNKREITINYNEI